MKKKSLLIAGAALLAMGVPALAAMKAGPGGPGPKAMAMHDVTRAQVEAQVKEYFAKIDANKDGAITMDEVKAYQDARRAERLDAMFKQMDKNGDGMISRDEFAQAHADRPPMMPPRAGGMAGAPDAPGAPDMPDAPDAPPPPPAPGMGMGAGPGQPKGPMPPMMMKRDRLPGNEMRIGGRMFTMADANKDGKVTLKEATDAALAHFDKIDANKDGTVTAQEHRAYMKQMMQQHKGRPGAPARKPS